VDACLGEAAVAGVNCLAVGESIHIVRKYKGSLVGD